MAEHIPNISRWRTGDSNPSPAEKNRNGRRAPPIRQPLNCLPCRKAKIKCDRHVPCSSCRRRQMLDLCSYIAESGSQREDLGVPGSATSPNLSTDFEMDMASRARLEYLESLFQEGRLGRVVPESEADGNTSFQDSGIAGIEFSGSPGSSVAMSVPTSMADVSASEIVTSHLRQFRWDAGLGKSLTEQVAATTKSSRPVDIGFPFDTGTSLDTLLALLPPKQQCDYLISRYFALFSPLFHVLHNPTFLAEYRQFTHDPRSVGRSWLALLFVLLALSVTCLEDFDPVLNDLGRETNGHGNIKSLAGRFRSAAMKSLASDNFLAEYNMSTLQALILLIYAINHSEGAGQSWTLLGIALNIAIALGCHIDGQELHLQALETEQRRRCWAGIMMLQTVQAGGFGLTDTMRLAKDRVQLPADVNDADIKTDRIDPASSQPTEMSYLLYKFRLYKLTAEICKHIFEPTKPDIGTISRIEHQIRNEEVKWNERYLLDGGPNLLQDRDQAHWTILHSYANQLRLLLHRPFLNLSPNDPAYYPGAFLRCVSAGIALLDSHRLFCTAPSFRQYRWFTNGLCSFFALHGAVTVAACLMGGRTFDESARCRTAFDEAVIRFRERKDHSNICNKALPVLLLLQSMILSKPLNLPQTATQEVYTSHDEVAPGSAFDETFQTWTQADRWTGPGAIQWDLWDPLLNAT